MKLRKRTTLLLCLSMGVAAVAASADAERAIVINDQRLHREARLASKTVGRVAVGDEVTVTAREGALYRVSLPNDAAARRAVPVMGWTLANGLVILDANPRAAALLYEAADGIAQEDSLEAWRTAARLFRKAAALAQGGPYVPAALYRAAELTRLADVRANGPLAQTAATNELASLVRSYPKTPVAARAAFLLLRSSLCDSWDGTPGCPESEIGLISRYLVDYPESEKVHELRHAIAYRHAALVEIYLEQGKAYFSAEKAVEHKAKAREVVELLLQKAPGSLWAARGERLLWSLENNVGVYSGIEVALRRY